MSRRRRPVLLFESNRGRDLKFVCILNWAAVIGMAVAIWLNLSEAVPGGDGVNVLILSFLLLLVMAILSDRRRRATMSRVYRLPEGLVFETTGLTGALRRYVRSEDLGLIRATAPDVRGRMTLRLPDGGAPLVMHTGVQGLNLGLPEPKPRKR